MTTEEKAKAYDKAIEKIKYVMEHGVQPVLNKEDLQDIFPELAESEDEKIRNVIRGWIYTRPASFFDNGISKEEILAWLEKQGEPKEYTFKSLPRLLDMIEPTSKAKAYCQKLIDTLVKEGYATDAKIVGECLKQMNGERVALATMDEKQEKPKWSEEDEEQPNNKPLFFEKGKWYTCIAKVDGFKVGHTYQSKMDGTVSNDSGAMYMYHNDVNLIFRPATEAEVEKGGELRKWLNFGKTHEGTTITIPKDLKGTDTDGGVVGEKGEQGNNPEAELVSAQIDSLKRRIEDNQLGCIVQRLDKIIELLQSAILPISRSPYVPPIIYKNPLDPDPNELGGWKVTASTEGGEE